MAQGTVRLFNAQKGYGFISPAHGGGDVFVRYSDIESAGFRSLQEGEKVSYEVAQHRKGVQAQNVAKAWALENRNRLRATKHPTKGNDTMEHEQRTDRFTALEDYFSGYEVYDPAHSKIGKVEDLFVDENHEPEYVSVTTGFLGTKSTLIPWQIVEVRDEEQRLVVAADKDAVKGGSAFNNWEITPEYENEVHSYYGLEGTRASEDRGLYGGHFGHSAGEHPSEVRPGTRLGDTETGDVRGHRNGQEDLRQPASGVEDELRVPCTEAELRAGTREREAGAVNMHKRVRTDRERREVPTMRE